MKQLDIYDTATVRGFTLVEMLIVMAVLAIVMTIAVPSFSSFYARKKLEGHAAEFITDLQYARSEAVQRNVTVRLVTGAGGGCYVIHTWPTSPTGTCNCANPPGSACTPTGSSNDPIELRTVQFGSSGVSITSGIPFEFEPVRGTRTGSGNAILSSTDGPWQLSADVNPVGRVSSCSPAGTLVGHPACTP